MAAPFTEADLRVMDALGWDRQVSPPSQAVPDREVTVYDTQNNHTWAIETLTRDVGAIVRATDRCGGIGLGSLRSS